MLKGRFERLMVKGLLWVAIGGIIAFSVFMLGAVWEVRGKQRLAEEERNHARAELASVEERERSLTEAVARFETERGMEEEFRKRFPVAREGEEVIVLVDAPEASGETVPEQPKGFWDTVQGWFGF